MSVSQTQLADFKEHFSSKPYVPSSQRDELSFVSSTTKLQAHVGCSSQKLSDDNFCKFYSFCLSSRSISLSRSFLLIDSFFSYFRLVLAKAISSFTRRPLVYTLVGIRVNFFCFILVIKEVSSVLWRRSLRL